MVIENEDNYKAYVHINKMNNKCYVGITKRKLYERWNKGKGYKNCVLFYRAIQKYGWDNFDHELIASGLTRGKSKYIKCDDVLFDTILDCAKFYNINSRTMNNWLTGFRKMPQKFKNMNLRYAE